MQVHSDARTVEDGPSTPLRILVVDDNEDAADSLALVLKLQGHEVCAVYDGPNAIQLASAFQPQVVLLDLAIPKMDGCEIARRLRGQDGLQDVLLVATTGCTREKDRLQCHEAGFDHFLLKPLDLNELRELLTHPGSS